MRFNFHTTKIYFFAFITLSAILSGAFSAAFYQSKIYSEAAMVYCPLTKKLQPVNPPSVSNAFSLNEICAADTEKTRLALAVAENLKVKFSNFDQTNFENLAFDFWQKGQAAFENLPNSPNLPEKFAAKNSFSPIGFGDNFNFKIIWKATENFAFQAQPRPPDVQSFPQYNFETVLKLNKISRRIAPRAPPVLV